MDKGGYIMKDPRLLGQDAVQKATAAQLIQYEREIAKSFYDNAVLPQMFPTETRNTPGAASINWKQLKKPGKPSYSLDGDEEDSEQASYTPLTNEYVVVNKMYHIKYYELQRAIMSGFPLQTETASAIGNLIAQEVDYALMQGVDKPPADLTGIAEFPNAQDAGAPGGVWDVTTNMYNDMLKIVDKLAARGKSTGLKALFTPGIIKVLYRLLSDGVTTFDKMMREWLKDLGIDSWWVSSHPFTQATGPTSTDKLTGADGTATNQVWVFHPDAKIKIIYAHPLQTVNRPVQDGDVYKNVRLKPTIKYGDDFLIGYMDAIDTTT